MEREYRIYNVLLPLAIPKVYSYRAEPAMYDQLSFGIRVEVPLRNKLYSGILIEETTESSSLHKLRYIRSVIDDTPIITRQQYDLWAWMADYYMCTIGEVMNVALPSGLKLNSETKLIVKNHIDEYRDELSDKEYMLAEAISIQNELTINQVQEILEQKTVYPYIRSLLDKEILFIREELKTKYKPKVEDYVKLSDPYNKEDNSINAAFDLCKRSEKQTRALLSYIQLSHEQEWVSKKAIYAHAQVDSPVINALLKKEIILLEKKEVSRLNEEKQEEGDIPPLNPHQEKAKAEILEHFDETNLVLLFGITGSGKTRIYIDLIRETMARGEQVLYLLPEIALTTQIVSRLKSVFTEDIGVYHSKMNDHQKVELWKATMKGKKLIMGARSSIFLPFTNLGLIIIDEEHDPSFKQSDPAPRYNGRDTAIYLSKAFGAKVLLGTATPSLETFLNAKNEKYALVKLLERHGDAVLPDIDVVDLRDQYKKGLMQSMFSKEMKDAITLALNKGEQILLFQNRRGYSPTLQCIVCDFKAECPNCDLSLTVHQYHHELRCHYCGYRHPLPRQCPSCGFDQLNKLGFGTEKIEDEIKKVFPSSRVSRMDFDTANTRNAYESILTDFKNKEIDILVGTQMITKGLDFENISVVGILAADKILFFPDHRANERAFQLFTQVAGRAGRKNVKGRVIIQTFNPQHPVVQETRSYDYPSFYRRELTERKKFLYPPFFRMIMIHIKHKRMDVAEDTAKIMTEKLKAKLANRVIGPSTPGVSRLRGFYIQNIIVKMEKNLQQMKFVKDCISEVKNYILQSLGRKSVRIIVDVDP